MYVYVENAPTQLADLLGKSVIGIPGQMGSPPWPKPAPPPPPPTPPSSPQECHFMCGQCYNKCRQDGEDHDECEHRRIGCHYACDHYGNTGSECSGMPNIPPRGTPIPPPPTCTKLPIVDNPRHCRIATNCCMCVSIGATVLATGGLGCAILCPSSACAGLVTMPLGAATTQIVTATGGVITCLPHGLQRMQERGITPSVVLNAIENGVCSPGNRMGTVVYEYENVRVVVNSCTNNVISVMKTGSSW